MPSTLAPSQRSHSSSSEFYDSFDGDDFDAGIGIGLSNAKLNHGIRKKLDAMNKLHSTGVQVDIDLPQIAVIGNQSAGKSSLIESISGITLPRASGTCTRCPIECRLSRSDGPWHCIVSLRLTIDKDGQPLGQARNERFGDIITKPEDVKERIRRAQLAILNPQTEAAFFSDSAEIQDAYENQLLFSSNCVTLQISGEEVADLSFCDLPGLIASASSDRGGEESIALVNNLVSSYIKKSSCIILLTVACETDFENQGAHRLAKQYDPDGKRTIGVLTKPDRIPLGEESSWLSFIRNEREPLENNWFCVKQPSSKDLKENKTWAQTRQAEHDYFSLQSPWSELEDMYQKYLRTGNLVHQLSTVLSDLIGMRMPQIQDELERSISHTRELISRLPPPPSSDPRSEILTMLHLFASDLGQQIQGVPDNFAANSGPGLIQSILPLQEKFRRAVRSTEPMFVPFEKSNSIGKVLPKAKFLAEDEGDEWWAWGATNQHSKPIYIDEVLERARGARTRELPGHYPFVVQKNFIEGLVQQWRTPSLVLCKEVHNTMTEHVKKVVHRHFGSYGQGYLEQRVRAILQQHMNECLDRADERVKWLHQLEDVPFSVNTHYLAAYREKFLTLYRGTREKYAQQHLGTVINDYNASKANQFPKSTTSTQIATPAASASASASTMAAPISSSTTFGRNSTEANQGPPLSTLTAVNPFSPAAANSFGSTTAPPATSKTASGGFGENAYKSNFGQSSSKFAFGGSTATSAATPSSTSSQPMSSLPFGFSKLSSTPSTASTSTTVPQSSFFSGGSTPSEATPSSGPSGSFSTTLSSTTSTSTATPQSSLFSGSQVETVNKILGGLAEIGMTGIKAEDLPKLLPPDIMEPALGIMADVRAYFQVAYKRFADNVPLAVDLELVRGVEKNLPSVLYASLGINGPRGDSICKELAQESRKIADRRSDLQKKLERLESARIELFAAGV